MLAVMAGPFSLVPTAAGFQSTADGTAGRGADGVRQGPFGPRADGRADIPCWVSFVSYGLPGAVGLHHALERFDGGRIVIDVADLLLKCPVEPME
ncbi:hypothetical protein [Streptomyces sp. D2-8]|uniref:hypothetical protein n=1 Tax=Streptomyces sp. D2-8 TaxID=2707767 RepID=UPI0020C02CDD|nr:hypothetical protein [Streptomyces sp. D2-8]